MNWKHKALIILGVLVVIGSLVFIIKQQHDTIERQKYMETSMVELKKLQDNVVRSQASYVNKKDIEQFAKNNGINLAPIEEDLKKLDASVKGISVTTVKTPGANITNIYSSESVPRPDKPASPPSDKYKYLENTQKLKLEEPTSSDGKSANVPFGDVSFSAWKDKPWELNIKPREYTANSVLSTDEDGRHFVHNQLTITVDNKKYSLPISNSQFVEQYPEEKFRWWNPKFALNLNGGVSLPTAEAPLQGAFSPGLGFSFLSYGKSNINPKYIFAQVGAAYNLVAKEPQFTLSPILFNISPFFLFEHTYIGPSIGFDLNQRLSILGTISVSM